MCGPVEYPIKVQAAVIDVKTIFQLADDAADRFFRRRDEDDDPR